ncbi:hypothetical protein [Paracidovorax anthurii]|uniref:Uncharacterized protein n=1 Tax=Paracidovorax anthurii TaxID=78229 RepID=A0A328ZVD9_9BURK|nr:hypothetical protein [Paracidovorax anthurii]RAR86186.1 hypothetical protein AX018_1002147 [Paracidovorax anthurii]
MDLLTLQRRAVAAIAAITVLTGAAQMAAGGPLLALISNAPTPLGAHLFATVGMFMVLFGGATLHAQRQREALPIVLLWGGLQKLLAAALVAWGVARGAFVPLALAVAAFDFASGLLYWSLRRKGG